MDEDEIEQWYDAEKEKALEEYTTALEGGKDRKEAEKEFNLKIMEIMKRYNQLMAENLKKQGRKRNYWLPANVEAMSIIKDFISKVTAKLPFLRGK
jgi:hypothetical protein